MRGNVGEGDGNGGAGAPGSRHLGPARSVPRHFNPGVFWSSPYFICTPSTMSSSLQVLPDKNEEYGTKEYWYAYDTNTSKFALTAPGIVDISSEFATPRLSELASSRVLPGNPTEHLSTGSKLMQMLHLSSGMC